MIAVNAVARRYAAARRIPVASARLAVVAVARRGTESAYYEDVLPHIRPPMVELAEALQEAFGRVADEHRRTVEQIVHALAGMHPLGGTSADREGDGR